MTESPGSLPSPDEATSQTQPLLAMLLRDQRQRWRDGGRGLGEIYLEQETLARFRTEAEAIARLQHAHIVQIYEVGDHEGQPFMALEFVDGGSLAATLKGQPQPARPAAQLLETLARTVDYAHQRGILH